MIQKTIKRLMTLFDKYWETSDPEQLRPAVESTLRMTLMEEAAFLLMVSEWLDRGQVARAQNVIHTRLASLALPPDAGQARK